MEHSGDVDTTRFLLLTQRLVLIPTPLAISIPKYRSLYARLHRDASFCEMAFGHHFPAVDWSDERTQEVIETRDIMRSWRVRGMGDFAVGLRSPEDTLIWQGCKIRRLASGDENLSIVEPVTQDSLMLVEGHLLQAMQWVGYAGVRDATTTSLRPRNPDEPSLPPWEEMVELRYGIAPEYWGQGVARGAAEAVMQWAAAERGVTRCIAETERLNTRSARVLEKMGFTLSGTTYWEEPSEVEWERILTKI